jgi:segregation and condensation protein A
VLKRQEDKIDPIRSGFGKIEKDEINMEEKQIYIEDYVKTHKTFSFRNLLEKQGSKMEVIVTFMAVLEMMKQGVISIVQEETFSDIIITSALAA